MKTATTKIITFEEISTPRLDLRMPDKKYAGDFLELWTEINDDWNYDSLDPEGLEKVESMIDWMISGNNKNVWCNWSIFLAGTDELIGTISLENVSKKRRIVEVGYELRLAHQGKGYMKEALEAATEYAFRKLRVYQIRAYTHINNGKSVRLLERNGFVMNPDLEADEKDHVVYCLEFNSN